jgi:hypothetical protein
MIFPNSGYIAIFSTMLHMTSKRLEIFSLFFVNSGNACLISVLPFLDEKSL